MDLTAVQQISEVVSGYDYESRRQATKLCNYHLKRGWALLAIHQRVTPEDGNQAVTVYIFGHEDDGEKAPQL